MVLDWHHGIFQVDVPMVIRSTVIVMFVQVLLYFLMPMMMMTRTKDVARPSSMYLCLFLLLWMVLSASSWHWKFVRDVEGHGMIRDLD